MLSAADLETFARLRIPAEMLESTGIERVTDDQARAKYGLTGHGDFSGVCFPYFDPISGYRWTARIRRDNPEVEDNKVRRKYMSPHGDRRHLYFVRGTAGLLRDVSVPIILVEAEKSALGILAWAVTWRCIMLTIYRRHRKSCEHRNEGRAYRRCHCPIWVDGFLGRTEIRESMKLRDGTKAQQRVSDWEAKGSREEEDDSEGPVTVAHAGAEFLRDARARGLRRPTLYKYRLLLRRLRDFSEQHGVALHRGTGPRACARLPRRLARS